MMGRILAVLGAMAVVVGLPFALKPEEGALVEADDVLVLISPHNEAIRYEFTLGFSRWYRERTGRTVRMDWRSVGGTSEIAKYLASEYYTAFRRQWEAAGRAWTREVEAGFDNPNVAPAGPGEEGDAGRVARREFLNSGTGIGVDVFFGGGEFDFTRQARAGRLVRSRILETHPEWFGEGSIPQRVSGELFYDPEGRWFGTCLSAFGMVFNRDSLKRLGFEGEPVAWEDLTRPELFRQVALADPTKSGSAAKAFEMIIQQQMRLAVEELGEEAGVRAGWRRGLEIIFGASANARYFTDAATKVPMDVSLGDAAIGMSIDFFGRFQSEAVAREDGTSRVGYVTPRGGSTVGVDPVGILRGAPNREVAELFVEYVLSLEGQKLWNFKVGEPGGPRKYALRRPPIRKELYRPEFAPMRSDPDVNPYEDARDFYYHAEWTGPVFRAMAFIIRVGCLDAHQEQVAAWREVVRAGMPEAAVGRFWDVSFVDYDTARNVIAPVLASADRLREVRLASELGERFRRQYREALELARRARGNAVAGPGGGPEGALAGAEGVEPGFVEVGR